MPMRDLALSTSLSPTEGLSPLLARRRTPRVRRLVVRNLLHVGEVLGMPLGRGHART
jgi:hypothetical protein